MEKAQEALKAAEAAFSAAVEKVNLTLEAKIKTPTAKSSWMWEQDIQEQAVVVAVAKQALAAAELDAARSHRNEPTAANMAEVTARVAAAKWDALKRDAEAEKARQKAAEASKSLRGGGGGLTIILSCLLSICSVVLRPLMTTTREQTDNNTNHPFMRLNLGSAGG